MQVHCCVGTLLYKYNRLCAGTRLCRYTVVVQVHWLHCASTQLLQVYSYVQHCTQLCKVVHTGCVQVHGCALLCSLCFVSATFPDISMRPATVRFTDTQNSRIISGQSSTMLCNIKNTQYLKRYLKGHHFNE